MNLKLKQVPKSYKPAEACLYSIAHPHFYDGLYGMSFVKEYGYIGVTGNKLSKRFTDHKATRNGEFRQYTGEWLHEYGYAFEECVRLLAEGTMEEMLALENKLRPIPNMGMNRKTGG